MLFLPGKILIDSRQFTQVEMVHQNTLEVLKSACQEKRIYHHTDHTEIRKMNFFAVSALNLIVHVGFCFVFAVANDLGLMLYKQFLGETASRGYTPGSITRLALLVFVIANLAIALAPWKTLKTCMAVAATLFLALFLLPEHPLRALFYFLLTGALSAIAIVLAARVVQVAEAHGNKTGESK